LREINKKGGTRCPKGENKPNKNKEKCNKKMKKIFFYKKSFWIKKRDV
jgi:hypothetical protein